MSKIQILFGSQSGNAQNLAHVVGESLEANGLDATVLDMGAVDPEEIFTFSHLIIVTSTYGDGEAPDNASEWLSFLKFGEEISLSHLSYAVIGLGDTYYPHFCQCSKDFDLYLSKLGGNPLVPRLDCDLYYEDQYPEWLGNLIQVLKKSI